MEFVFLLFVLFLFVGAPLFIIYACYRSDPNRHEQLPNEARKDTAENPVPQRIEQPNRTSTGFFFISLLALLLSIRAWVYPTMPQHQSDRALSRAVDALLIPLVGEYTNAVILLFASAFFWAVASKLRSIGK